MYCGYITYVKNIKPAENADKLNICEAFGNTIVVDKNVNENDLYVYFPCDGQLSLEFCLNNKLLRKLPDGTPSTGYLDPNKRNIVAIKLRGNKSDGLILPISSFNYCFDDNNANIHLKVGDTITCLNGHDICQKYIPNRQTKRGNVSEGNRVRKKKTPIAPLFVEHADTEQLAYNMDAFKSDDLIEITLKMHGTSQRTGYLPMFKKYKRSFMDIIKRRTGTPIYEYGYVSGTRRTILNDWEGGFYGSNQFRKKHADFFEGKLHKGEEVYYEVVGFTDDNTPIMGSVSNKKTNDKEFINQYGNMTTFSYGCSVSDENLLKSDFYVYRMTMTNEDGDIVEYSPDFMRYRCEQMGAKCVPVLWKGYIPDSINGEIIMNNFTPGEYIKSIAEQYYDGPDPIGKTHIREGVVIRIVNRPKFCAYKHKNFYFKCIEGLVKAEETAPDMEEAEELINDEN